LLAETPSQVLNSATITTALDSRLMPVIVFIRHNENATRSNKDASKSYKKLFSFVQLR